MSFTRLPRGLRLALSASFFIFAGSTTASGAAPDALQIAGGITAVYQQELDTGADDFSASGDFTLTLPTGSGRWFLYLEGATGVDTGDLFNTYPEINGDAGSVQDSDGSGHVQVSELFYEFNLDQHSSLMIGQVDTSAHIDRSKIANDETAQFLGNSFVNNATIAFPDYTIGAVYRRAARERMPEITIILSSANGIADDPSRSYRELIDVTGDGNGIFTAAAARWIAGNTEFGAGIWARTDDHPKLDNAARNGSNYGAFVVYERVNGAHAINLRAGLANPAVSNAAGFASVAYQLQQQHGTFGLGLARIVESSKARSPGTADTTHVEAYYRLPLLADTLHVSANLQYVANPGFDRSGTTAEAHALVAGLRFDFIF